MLSILNCITIWPFIWYAQLANKPSVACPLNLITNPPLFRIRAVVKRQVGIYQQANFKWAASCLNRQLILIQRALSRQYICLLWKGGYRVNIGFDIADKLLIIDYIILDMVSMTPISDARKDPKFSLKTFVMFLLKKDFQAIRFCIFEYLKKFCERIYSLFVKAMTS